MARPRAVFFGTPDFAVPSLRALLEIADVGVVVTQPDRPSGRGMKVTPAAVKSFAVQRGLEVVQPEKIRARELAERLRAVEPEVGVVTAYGRILPRSLLELPRMGCVNVHASLLPRWRGAAPIQWAIASGDAETGVCLMKMDEGLDTGDVLACRRTPIAGQETAGELATRLAEMGSDLVARELPRFLAGMLEPVPQDGSKATLAPMLRKVDGLIDWRWPAQRVHDRIRAMQPWPGAYGSFRRRRVKLCKSRIASRLTGARPGVVTLGGRDRILAACGDGVVQLDELQLDGRRPLPAREFLAGVDWEDGECFDLPEGAA
jgi:methionyl-tRNA formyltransferase